MTASFDHAFYTISEARRLTGVSPAALRGWISGFPNSKSAPVISRQHEPLNGRYALGFLDLIEARFIGKFRAAGVSMQAIRKAAAHLREEMGNNHPFAMNLKFCTDRKRIFRAVQQETNDLGLLDLGRNQWAMYDVVEQSLAKDLEFDGNDLALAWRPYSVNPNIVVDPQMAFGKPILRDAGIPTETIYSALKAEGHPRAVANWFNISVHQVNQAVEFEVHLLQ